MYIILWISAVNEPRVYGNDGGFPLFLDPDPVSSERQDDDYFHPLRGGNGLATGNIGEHFSYAIPRKPFYALIDFYPLNYNFQQSKLIFYDFSSTK